MAAWEGDLLGREEVADFLQNLLESDDSIKVINIDSPWGTGKTFFLKKWQAQLEQNRGVVYFNAWEKDYTGDPFISLVSAIKDQLEKQIGTSAKQKRVIRKFKSQASQTFLATAPVAFKIFGKGLAKKALGIDADEAGRELIAVVEGVSEAAIKSVIENSKKDEKVIKDFENIFKELVAEVSNKKAIDNCGPVYILIDELDRCRPTYAIELLERVKHFFSVPGCKFIIASDTQQLQHSIKAIYGSGFNSHEYLKRFFDLEYTLDNRDITNWVKMKFDEEDDDALYCLGLVRYAADNMFNRNDYDKKTIIPKNNTIVSEVLNSKQIILLALAQTFNCSLRGLERICRHINASLINIHEKSVHFFYLAYLIFLRDSDPDIYNGLINSKDNEREMKERLLVKFKPKSLYFRYFEVDVHNIAFDYLNFIDMDMSQLEEGKNQEVLYKRRLRQDLRDSKAELQYNRVISLASRISVKE